MRRCEEGSFYSILGTAEKSLKAGAEFFGVEKRMEMEIGWIPFLASALHSVRACVSVWCGVVW